MPWTNVTSGEEINRCVILARSKRSTVTELCEQLNEAARPATNIRGRSAGGQVIILSFDGPRRNQVSDQALGLRLVGEITNF